MFPVTATASCYRPTEIHQSERRVHQRYPITLEVECKLIDANGVQRMGFGRTINISSRGVLLDLKGTPPTLGSIHLSIMWPFLLDGSVPLKLVVWGEIIRSDGNRIAVAVTKHEFRTANLGNLKKAACL